jgi:hypothetical protein
MVALNDKVLLNALAIWVGQLKCPYRQETKASNEPVRLISNSPNAWLEIRQMERGMMEITCIHRVIEQDEYFDLDEIRRECEQFNSLMERVRLPVFIWEDKINSEFQLRWQQTLLEKTDLEYVQRFFEQSLYLANALQSRLGWALNNRSHPLSH